jgi:hypothetical protein
MLQASNFLNRNIFFKIISITFWLAILFTTGFGQSFRGIIRDHTTKEVLPYANIGVKKRNIGGISDQSGTFQVDVSRASSEDSIVISYVGYVSQAFLISNLDFDVQHLIDLKPSSHVLKELTIRSKPEIITLGNKSKSTRHSGWGDFSSSRGRAIGLLVKTPDFSVKLNKVFFHIDDCEFDSARVRINFLRVEDGNIRSFESQKKNIFVTIQQRKGWIEVPLHEDIVLKKEKVIVAIEWVDAWAKPRGIDEGGSYLFTLSLAKSSGSHYIRQAPEEQIQLTTSEFTPSIYLECFAIRD